MTNDINIKVEKRGGRGLEPLNIEKIHEMVEYACEDIKGCLLYTSPSPRD